MDINNSLQQGLEATIKKLRKSVDGDVKVSVYDLETKSYAHVNSDKPGWAASIIKVPILIKAAEEIAQGRLPLSTALMVNHNYTLEQFDIVSRMPDDTLIKLSDLLHYMVVKSDNEATNMLIALLGIENINQFMWSLGMKKSMLGHLLCPGAYRHTSEFNHDGSNITCPDDMVCAFRHIYDPELTALSQKAKALSKAILSYTTPAFMNIGKFKHKKILAKEGLITSDNDGDDVHEIGIISNRLIVCIMANKICQNQLHQINAKSGVSLADKLNLLPLLFIRRMIISFSQNSVLRHLPIPNFQVKRIYQEVMGTIGRHYETL